MVKLEISDGPDANWNARLLKTDHATLFQTVEYAKFAQRAQGMTPSYHKFLDEKGEIVAQNIVFVKSSDGRNLKSLLKKTIRRNKQTIWHYGPVVFDRRFLGDIATSMYDFLVQNNNAISGLASPLSGMFTNVISPNRIEWCTFLIDLSLDKAKIWDNIEKHSAQKNITRSKSRGITVREMNRDDLAQLHDLRKDKINKEYTESLSELQSKWDQLHNIGWTGFLAFLDDVPVGGINVSYFNGYIMEEGISRSTVDYEKKLYSQDLLKWTVIEWGKRQNFRFYDLTGANPSPQNDKERGILRYKAKWGGRKILFYRIKRGIL